MWPSGNRKRGTNVRITTRHITQMRRRFGLPERRTESHSAVFLALYGIGLAVLKTGKLVYAANYYVGLGVLTALQFGVNATTREFSSTRYHLTRRLAAMQQPQFRAAIGSFLVLALLSWVGLRSVNLVAYGQQMKGRVLGIAKLGGQHLVDAQTAIKEQNFERAQSEFLLAQKSFKDSGQELQQANALLRNLMDLLPQKRDAQRLVEASALISKAGSELVLFQQEVGKLKITQAGIQSTAEPNREVLSNLYYHINNAAFDVSQAQRKIEAVDADNFPAQYRPQVQFLRENISYLTKSLQSLEGVFGLVRNGLSGQKQVLFLFQNNNELRATGGFMGTFGSARMKDGKIEHLHISSIYDLDGQLAEKIAPPSPVMNVNDRWYMRDSNWFADFRQSAAKVSSFYEKEGGETPDMVIAMTAEVVRDLLHVTGPIEMQAYGVTLTEENFIETTQVATSVSDSSPENNPKQMLADFFPILLQRLSDLKPEQAPALLEVLARNFNAKHVVLFSRDPAVQKQLEAYNWAGAVAPTDRDYLSVVSSNLGGTKTDVYIDQRIELDSKVNADGTVIDTLRITRANRLPKMEHGENTSFLRIYVPEGSELLSSDGFDYKNLDTKVLEGYRTDPQVYEWEKNTVKNMVTGTLIGREAGKTFFGNWLTLAGGESRTVTLSYRLPFKLADVDRLSLLLQKQMGSRNSDVRYTVYFAPRTLEWKNFATAALDPGKVSTDITLNKDYFLGQVLTRR